MHKYSIDSSKSLNSKYKIIKFVHSLDVEFTFAVSLTVLPINFDI